MSDPTIKLERNKCRVELPEEFDVETALNKLAVRRQKLAEARQAMSDEQAAVIPPIPDSVQKKLDKIRRVHTPIITELEAKVAELEGPIRTAVLDRGETIDGTKAPKSGGPRLQCQYVKPSIRVDVPMLVGMAKMVPQIAEALTECESTPKICEIREKS